MLSVIEVQCPHCGARGQIMIPPVGAIIIGPCPQCKELVVVFCGQVLALNREIMEDGNIEERQDHLLSVLTELLRDRIGKLMNDDGMPQVEAEAKEGGMGEDFEAAGERMDGEANAEHGKAPLKLDLISQSELDRFTEIDLKLLDNKAYFKSVFEQK